MTPQGKEEKNYNREVTDNRRVNVVYHFPFLRFKAVSMVLTQKDLITIYRQVNNEKIRQQLKNFVHELDMWSEYDTDIDGQEIKRTELMDDYEREILKHEEKIIR